MKESKASIVLLILDKQQVNISQDIMMKIILPPLSEQKCIVQAIENLLSDCNQMIK